VDALSLKVEVSLALLFHDDSAYYSEMKLFF